MLLLLPQQQHVSQKNLLGMLSTAVFITGSIRTTPVLDLPALAYVGMSWHRVNLNTAEIPS